MDAFIAESDEDARREIAILLWTLVEGEFTRPEQYEGFRNMIRINYKVPKEERQRVIDELRYLWEGKGSRP